MSRFSILVFVFFYLFCFIHLSYSLNNGFSVELIHRDSLKSPIYCPSETKFQRVYNAVHRSINRGNHFAKQFSLNTNKPVSTLTPDSCKGLWIYANSYKNIQCSSTTCTHAEDIHISCSKVGDVCEYSIAYDDDGATTSQGNLSTETLTLDSTSGSNVSFHNIVIGCGHNNRLFYSGPNSGIIGMGNGPMSLIRQLGSSIGNKFSYCLIPFYSDNGHSNYSNKLNFGDAAIVSGEGVVSTPIVQQDGPGKGYYYVTLEAISVGNKRIEYEGYKVEGTNASTRSIIIDSGTPITLLPEEFYNRLCYKSNTTTLEQSNIFPIITAHFSGADVKLNYNSTFVPFEEGTMCFSFLPRQSRVIFGSFSQHNLLVGYDLQKNIMSFKPTDCTKY
ncbi:hypothetical protein P8452_19471 [Trifolium repens]|nr:hypothetical protein P8452_19471 [Trifolium repens]